MKRPKITITLPSNSAVSTPAASASTTEASEFKLWDLNAELTAKIATKFDSDKQLALLESRIFKLETSYLLGKSCQKSDEYFKSCITRGYSFLAEEHVVSPVAADLEGTDEVVAESDRLFSTSSLSYKAALDKADRLNADSLQSSRQSSRATSPAYFGKFSLGNHQPPHPGIKQPAQTVSQDAQRKRKRKR